MGGQVGDTGEISGETGRFTVTGTVHAQGDIILQQGKVDEGVLRVGDPVIVVGTPYGLAGSMSEGIVSALNRTLVTDEYSITNVIQTTAPINPGNSGGPLLNYQGQVVGIVTAIIQDSQGIGFAIPSDTILEGIEGIIAG